MASRPKQINHNHLRHNHRQAGELGRGLGAHLHRQRGDTHPGVAFDRFEIVERHDAMRAKAIQKGDDENLAARDAERGGGGGDPGQGLIGKAAGRIAPPAVALEPERRCRIGPGERQPDGCGKTPSCPAKRRRPSRTRN
jgi:hypothetical protein